MAKSARASTRKRNNANLRAKVFGPAHDARTQRLSEKLQQLAAAPKPETDKAKNTEQDAEQKPDSIEANEVVDADADMEEAAAIAAAQPRSKQSKQSKGIKKRSARTKPRHQMVFPSDIARRKRQSKPKKG